MVSFSLVQDYYDDDMKRKAAGQTPLYFVGDQMVRPDSYEA